jgi:Protein of unknown function (DUF2934)
MGSAGRDVGPVQQGGSMAKRVSRSNEERPIAGKPPAPRRRGRSGPPGVPAGSGIDPADRHRLIAEAAYYRAERRGFVGGDAVQDWLAAEVEVAERFRETP